MLLDYNFSFKSYRMSTINPSIDIDGNATHLRPPNVCIRLVSESLYDNLELAFRTHQYNSIVSNNMISEMINESPVQQVTCYKSF